MSFAGKLDPRLQQLQELGTQRMVEIGEEVARRLRENDTQGDEAALRSLGSTTILGLTRLLSAQALLLNEFRLLIDGPVERIVDTSAPILPRSA